MYVKKKHLTTGRVFYVVNAFPSSVPGKTHASLTTIKVVDRPRAPKWFWASHMTRQYPCMPKEPVHFFHCDVKEDWPNAKFRRNPFSGRSTGDMCIDHIRENSCRRSFLKLKHALAYQKRILSGCWHAQEKAYVLWNDENKSVCGHN